MSNLKDRAAARLPLVPEAVAVRYAEAVAQLARVQIGKRSPSADRSLPAVSSFG